MRVRSSYGDLTRDGSIGGSLSRVLNLELQNPFSPTKVTGGGSDRRYHAYEAADRDTTVSRRHLLLNNSGGRRTMPIDEDVGKMQLVHCDEASPSYDSNVLSEVHDHDHYQDAVCDHHEEHEMHDDVQPNHVVDSIAGLIRWKRVNMTPYDHYVKDNAVPVVQNNASMVPNDVYVMIDNDLHESDVLSVSHTPRNTVANNLLNAELAIYKEQVELYERRARFELTEREQKIDEQLRIVICDRNIKCWKHEKCRSLPKL
ncbi:hypothetical protein Tco_0822089 [Tanacetum coccineum]|uniref:Uncharacterized protein n=1 Tax=Tanacetum coccineum TaxID=301880 RepID=A0ABQ5AE30_9ASTR